ncbi:splicing factor YJU2 [Teleopsis dalmanni]|uniref:splicing factor YJU2 n=1 Tax=Teleopsis dalmanni TaxID=139649 RepID=UPI0018CD8AD0|nr:splicing factor YJU2 [Teleopsis dalmanni]
MSERKVLNKYYPPDFDPSKIPRIKLPKNRQYTVRLMAPFNMRCKTCGEYIYKGKKFNARKEDVENETYLGIRIYRFYIKCTRCLQEISFKTDPKNTDYEIEAGATRNFMALKLAEEQARREEEEAREEEANNPMKLLENRTEQSRNEIEVLESLEELRDLNRRHQTVDYETLLKQYDNGETERERLERQEREDEEFIKSVQFKKQSAGSKIIAEEIIEEISDDKGFNEPPSKVAKTQAKQQSLQSTQIQKSKNPNVIARKQPLVLVKSKKVTENKTIHVESKKETGKPVLNNPSKGLSLLANYTDSSEDSN